MPSNIRVNKIGNWSGVKALLERLPSNVLSSVQAKTRQIANDLLDNIRTTVEGQGLRLKPLSPEYLSRKLAEGLDSRTLIATHEYLDKLKVQENGSGVDFTIFVGAFSGDIHENSGIDMALLAEYLENGTSRMPARPHMQPVWDRMKGKVVKDITSTVAKQLMTRGL